jgi:hypothetical protein
MLGRTLWTGLLLVTLTGCEIHQYTCTNPDKGHRDAFNNPDPCHLNDPDNAPAAGAEPSCETGQFAHWSHGWESPSWVWIGPEDQAPECPQGPTSVSYEGRADLVAPSVCEACTCDPPTGSCALPTKLTASAAECYAPGASTSFDAPIPWDGSCDGATQVPGGAAHSLTIDPIAMTENGCASGSPVAAKIVSLRWDTFARACDVALPTGTIDRSVCLPADPIAPGFKSCIFSDSEEECPNERVGNVFTEKHVFYHGVQDDRQCSTCTCGAPTGSACAATILIYGNDLTCNGPTFAQIPISSTKPACLDITLPGQALGSKSAEAVTYLPGTCPPEGGVANGTAIPTIPMTLCCRP